VRQLPTRIRPRIGSGNPYLIALPRGSELPSLPSYERRSVSLPGLSNGNERRGPLAILRRVQAATQTLLAFPAVGSSLERPVCGGAGADHVSRTLFRFCESTRHGTKMACCSSSLVGGCAPISRENVFKESLQTGEYETLRCYHFFCAERCTSLLRFFPGGFLRPPCVEKKVGFGATLRRQNRSFSFFSFLLSSFSAKSPAERGRHALPRKATDSSFPLSFVTRCAKRQSGLLGSIRFAVVL